MTDNNANISSLAAANLHTIALKSDGTVYGTGANTLGQLGDGTIVTKNVLTEMAPFLS
jgi:alpha-tubulin suppressor-like RCC1 family protein